MSFILDALKKSETDRQRQSGPALYEVRVARPQRSLPPWAVAIATLLGVNLVIISWLLLHRSSPPAAAPAAPAAAAAPAPGAAPPGAPPGYYAPAAQVPQAPQQAPQGQYPYGYSPPQGMPPQGMPPGQPAPGQPYAPGAYPPPSANNYPPPAPYPAPGQQPPYPQQQPAPVQPSGVAVNGGGGASSDDSGNPDDDAPAAAPEASTGGQVHRGTDSGLPFYPDPEAATAAGLPKLRMDFHAYGSTPQQRFVMINSRKLSEGQVSTDGIRVDEITPDGATISKGPARYFMPRP